MLHRASLIAAALLASLLSAAAMADSLKTPADFSKITDKATRSKALFTEAGKVIQSPRCLNCHPRDDSPTQGEDLHPHLPHVVRGPGGMGATALNCSTCHQTENFAPSGVPGHPLWMLAPKDFAWQGQSLGQICGQIKDPRRNGGRDLAALKHHMAEDSLVGWAWNPGGTRKPAPGTQKQFGDLIHAWIETGAHCPEG
jgi:mono/diheme cytochrome c family protein